MVLPRCIVISLLSAFEKEPAQVIIILFVILMRHLFNDPVVSVFRISKKKGFVFSVLTPKSFKSFLCLCLDFCDCFVSIWIVLYDKF